MREYIENACEEIHAAMFSGDAFNEESHRAELRQYIEGWLKEMKAKEDAEASEEDDSTTDKGSPAAENLIRNIFNMTNFADPDSYVADNPSGCLDTIHSLTKKFLEAN